MQLSEINFPVYYLGKEAPMQHEGVSFYTFVEDDDSSAPKLIYNILDDKNLPGDTLAKRRLELLKSGVRIHKLKTAIFFVNDMLKITKGTTWFIDAYGKIFEYRKTVRVPLIFRPISKIIKMPKGGCIVEAEGLPFRFKTLLTPVVEQKWVGLLKVNHGYMLYGLYSKPLKNTYRMI
jgi:hypothetical protein